MPHIAAGINLNLPVVGRFLRKGGAFFMRRSFRGTALYPIVFMKYLATMMARGHPIEYFIEGGRSRTGRLLQPKTGMLSMTVRSYLREPRASGRVRAGVLRLRAHRGGRARYIGELSGKPKEKEIVGWASCARCRELREKLRPRARERRRAHRCSTDCSTQHQPDWRGERCDEDARAGLVRRRRGRRRRRRSCATSTPPPRSRR